VLPGPHLACSSPSVASRSDSSLQSAGRPSPARQWRQLREHTRRSRNRRRPLHVPGQRHRRRYVRPAGGRRHRRTGQGPRLADDAAAHRRRRQLHRQRLPHLADDHRILLARPLRRSQLGQPASGPGFRSAECDPERVDGRGLRIGDDVAQARRIYGSAFVVLFSQGGSWRITTSTGILDGYLTAVPDRPTPPVPRVADVSAGSVGCPAASP
jgi:hypothetical protein